MSGPNLGLGITATGVAQVEALAAAVGSLRSNLEALAKTGGGGNGELAALAAMTKQIKEARGEIGLALQGIRTELVDGFSKMGAPVEKAEKEVKSGIDSFTAMLMVGNEKIAAAQLKGQTTYLRSQLDFEAKQKALWKASEAEAVAHAAREAAILEAESLKVLAARVKFQAALATTQAFESSANFSSILPGSVGKEYNKTLATTAVAAKQAEQAVAGLTSQVHFGSNAFREAGTLLGELAGGNLSRMRQSSFALANQMGLLALVFTPLGAVVAAAAVTLGVFFAAITKGEKETSDFKNVLVLTNGYIGLTKGSFDELARSVSDATLSSLGTAKEALLEMAKSGKLTGDALGLLAKDVILQTQLTGESLKSVVKDYEKMPDGVHKWAESHNESMHFMSAAQLEHIRLLELQGKKQEAMLEVGNALNKQFAKQTENLGYLEKAARLAKNALSDMWDGLLGIGREATVDDAIAKLQARIKDIEGYKATAGDAVGAAVARANASVLGGLKGQLADLQDARSLERQIVATKALSLETQQLGSEGDKILEQMGVRISKAGKEAEAITKVTAAIVAHNKAWTDAGSSMDQPYSTLTGQGYISSSQQKTMLQLVHEKMNGGGGSTDGGALALLKDQFKNEEAALTQHFAAEKALYTEQYHNKLINEGTYIAKSEQATSTYNASLLADYLKSLQAETAEEQQHEKNLPLNLGADARIKRVEAMRNALQVLANDGWAAVQKAITSSDEAMAKLGDDAVGAMLKGAKSNTEYWNVAEQNVKRTGDMAKALRDLASATDEERARAEAGIKVEDSHIAYLQKLQAEYDLSVLSLQNYMVVVDQSGTFNTDQEQQYLKLAKAAMGWGDALRYAKGEVDKLKTDAGDNAVIALEDKKLQELRNRAKTVADTLRDSFADALLTGGKSGLTKLKDAVKAAFLAPIRIILQAVMQPIANGFVNMGYSALGLGNATSTLGSVGGNALGSAGGSALFGGVGTVAGQYFSGSMSGANAAGTLYANASGGGLDALLATNGAYGTAAAASTVGSGFLAAGGVYGSGIAATAGGGVAFGAVGTGASAAGAAASVAPIPVIGWIAAAAILAYALLNKKGETRGGAQYGYSTDGLTAYNPRRDTSVAASGIGATLLEGPSGGDGGFGAQAKAAMNSTVQLINDIFKGTGQNVSVTGFQSGYESSTEGRGGVFTGGSLTGGLTFGESGKGDNYAGTLYESTSAKDGDLSTIFANFITDQKQSVIQAIQAVAKTATSVLPKTITDMVKGIDAEALSDTDAQALVDKITTTIAAVKSFRDAMVTLPFENLKQLSFDAAAGLLEAAGGFAALSTKMGTYYQNFYTQAQRNDTTWKYLVKTFTDLGVVLPATRDGYRQLMDSIQVTTPEGQKLYATLLGLSDAFASLYPAIEDTTAAVKTQKELLADVSTARDKLNSAYQTEKSRIEGVRDAWLEVVKSLKDFLTQLTVGPSAKLSPEAQYLASKSEFQTVYDQTKSDDPVTRKTALDKLQTVSQAFLDASQAYYGTSTGYFDDLAAVKSAVQTSALSAQASADVQQLQLDVLKQMVTGYLDLRTAEERGFADVVDALHELLAAASAANVSATLPGQTGSTVLGNNGGTVGAPGTFGGGGKFDSGGGYTTHDGSTTLPASGVQNIIAGNKTLSDLENLYFAAYGQYIPVGIMYNMPSTMGGWSDTQMSQWVRAHAPVPLSSGLDTVPYNNFPAMLHADETVLNREAAQAWRSGRGGNEGLERYLKAIDDRIAQLIAVEVSYARRDLAHGEDIARSSSKTADTAKLLYVRVPRSTAEVPAL